MARYFFFYVALVTLAAQAQENPAETAKPPQTTLGVSTEDTAHNDNSDRNQSLPIESTMENTIETVVTAQTADKASATEAEEDNAKSTQNQLSTPQAEGTTNSSKTRSSTPDISGTRREVTEATTQFVQTTSEHSPATSVTEKLSVTSTTTATRATTSLPKQTTVPQNTSNPPKDVSASQTRTTVDGGLATAQDTPSRLAETPIASSTTPPSNSPANASTADASTVNPAEGQSTSHGVDLYHPIIPDQCSACDIELCRRRCSHGLISRCLVEGEERECLCTRQRLKRRSAARFVPAKGRRVRRCSNTEFH